MLKYIKSVKPVSVSDIEGKQNDDFSHSIKRTVEAVALIEKTNNLKGDIYET